MKVNLTIRKKGKGVLGKDKLPFAARTMHVSDGTWTNPFAYTAEALLAALLNEKIIKIQIITEANDEWEIKKN